MSIVADEGTHLVKRGSEAPFSRASRAGGKNRRPIFLPLSLSTHVLPLSMDPSSPPLPAAPPLDDDEAARTVTVRFRGCVSRVVQDHRARGPEGEDNTGWQVWECSNVALRYLNDDANLAGMLRTDAGAPTPSSTCPTAYAGFAATRFLDLSAGAGLIALALAAAGGRAWASDIPTQLPQLRSNIVRNGLAGGEIGGARAGAGAGAGDAVVVAAETVAPSATHPIRVLPYWWGEDVEALEPARSEDARCGDAGSSSPPPPSTALDSPSPAPAAAPAFYDICVASDIVYIALRDGRAKELSTTLRALTRVCRCVLFAFEERLIREEEAFVEALASPGEDGEGGAVDVFEIKGAPTVLSKEEALQGVGGHRDTEVGSMFWEPPPIRMVVLRALSATTGGGGGKK